MCVITNNVFWLFDCHFAPNSVFVIFVFSLILHILVSLILLGLTWHGGGGGGVGILCNYFSANFAIVFFCFLGGDLDLRHFFLFCFLWNFRHSPVWEPCQNALLLTLQKKYFLVLVVVVVVVAFWRRNICTFK